MLLVARSQLVSQRQAIANTIRGLLKTFGLVIARGSKGLFPVRVREQIVGNAALTAIVDPLLIVGTPSDNRSLHSIGKEP